MLIAFRTLFGDHTGSNQACLIALILKEYDASNRFHCFVGDNASNNGRTLIKSLGEALGVNLGAHLRIHCAGHILNLIAKGTLYGTHSGKFEEELRKVAPRDQFKLYRKYGVVGKLHNFVNSVLASNKRRELFMDIQKQHTDETMWKFSLLNHSGCNRVAYWWRYILPYLY
jgi:hypothetical protein